jgi:hypothetical protein
MNRNIETCQSYFKKGSGGRGKNNVGDEPKQGTFVSMEMLQSPLYNYQYFQTLKKESWNIL